MQTWYSGKRIRARFKAIRVVAAMMFLAMSTVVTYCAWAVVTEQVSNRIRNQSVETLAVQAEVLNGVLGKYRLLPPLLVRQDNIALLFASLATNAQTQKHATAIADEIVGLSGARDVAFFSSDGKLLASARGLFGNDSSTRAALLKAARENRLGRASLRLKGSSRVYAFGSGVRRNGQLVGVIAVYVGFDAVERAWALSADPIFVSDSDGIIFLSNRESWLLKPVSEISEKAGNLPGIASTHIDTVRTLPLMGWKLHVLGNKKSIAAMQTATLAVAFLISALIAIIVFFQIGRVETQVMRERHERAQALRLERAVRDRTKALSRANSDLLREVNEHIETEQELKTVQKELIQTAKLAVVGQMSAALSHEINQPLAAIEAYAANTKKALALGKVSIAEDNLGRITAMVSRISELSRTLLAFSRRPDTKVQRVLLKTALDEALILIRSRAQHANIVIELDPALNDTYVEAGRIRLSQVFVNLFSNAIDVLEGRSDGSIRVVLENASDIVSIKVSDNGPGVALADRKSIFEPFFTTKVSGGNGIGLAIVYNIMQDFGGGISLVASDDGAEFRLWLKAAAQ